MAELHKIEPDDDAAPVEGFSEHPASPPSYVDLLRKDFDELQAADTVYIKVPGYESSGLQVKYHSPDSGAELNDIARKVQREEKDVYARNIKVAMDTMIYLCDGLYVQPIDVDEPVMLDVQEVGEPVRFDYRLCESLNWPLDLTSRGIVRKLFDGNDMALLSHAEKLNRWLMDRKANLDLELWQTIVGEG